MKIDSALTLFSEQYTREAMRSIDELSKDLGLTNQKATIKTFNIQEGFNTFIDAIKGYSIYKIENADKEKSVKVKTFEDFIKLAKTIDSKNKFSPYEGDVNFLPKDIRSFYRYNNPADVEVGMVRFIPAADIKSKGKEYEHIMKDMLVVATINSDPVFIKGSKIVSCAKDGDEKSTHEELGSSFINFLQYCIDESASSKLEVTPQKKIVEHLEKFIDGLFKEDETLIQDIPSFVEHYVSGIPKVISTVDEVKAELLEAGVDHQSIGDINGIVDNFMEKLHESFDPTMDKILWATGYNADVRLRNAVPKKKEKPVFL